MRRMVAVLTTLVLGFGMSLALAQANGTATSGNNNNAAVSGQNGNGTGINNSMTDGAAAHATANHPNGPAAAGQTVPVTPGTGTDHANGGSSGWGLGGLVGLFGLFGLAGGRRRAVTTITTEANRPDDNCRKIA